MIKRLMAISVMLAAMIIPAQIAHADAGYPYMYDGRAQVIDNGQVLIYAHAKGILYGRSGDLRVCVVPVSGITLADVGLNAYSTDAPAVVFKTGSVIQSQFYTGSVAYNTGPNYYCAHQRWEKTPNTPTPREVELDADNSCQPSCLNDNLFKLYDRRESFGGANMYTACVLIRIRAMDDYYPADAGPDLVLGSAGSPVCW